jgi:hypothetical protein
MKPTSTEADESCFAQQQIDHPLALAAITSAKKSEVIEYVLEVVQILAYPIPGIERSGLFLQFVSRGSAHIKKGSTPVQTLSHLIASFQ